MLCDECRKNETGEDGVYCETCKAKTKECKTCLSVKSIFDFEKNQRTPLGARNRRADCRACRKGKKGVSPKQRKEFEKKYPRPALGDTFQCPICEKIFTISSNQSVNLDHNNTTGEIRGWICGDCNTSIGRLGDNISTLARSILWLNDRGKL